jgi:hypothetical protein
MHRIRVTIGRCLLWFERAAINDRSQRMGEILNLDAGFSTLLEESAPTPGEEAES